MASASTPSRSLRIAALIWQMFLLSLGALISAIAVLVFEAPFNIAPGGISGIAIILNYLIGTPIGLVILIGNIPIQILAYRMLGGWRVIAATVYAVVLYAVLIDFLATTPYFSPVSQDIFLNAVFGRIVGGIGAGLVYRAGGTMGGTSTLGRILQLRYGIPLSTSTLYTDTIVVAIAGLIFGWEAALYALVVLFITGAVSDYTLEGPSVIRTAVIVTDRPKDVAAVLLNDLERGVTGWDAKGMFTEQPHTVLYVTVSRAQVNRLRRLVFQVDPGAFLVIGQGHSAYGHGFRVARQGRAAQITAEVMIEH